MIRHKTMLSIEVLLTITVLFLASPLEAGSKDCLWCDRKATFEYLTCMADMTSYYFNTDSKSMDAMKKNMLEACDAMDDDSMREIAMPFTFSSLYGKSMCPFTKDEQSFSLIYYIMQQCHGAVGKTFKKRDYDDLRTVIELLQKQNEDGSDKTQPEDQPQSDKIPENKKQPQNESQPGNTPVDKQQPQNETQPDNTPADKQQPQNQTQSDKTPADKQKPKDQTQPDKIPVSDQTAYDPSQYDNDSQQQDYAFGFSQRQLRKQKKKTTLIKNQPPDQTQADNVPADGQNANQPTQYNGPYQQSADAFSYANAYNSYSNQDRNQGINRWRFNNQQPQYGYFPQDQSTFPASNANNNHQGQVSYLLNKYLNYNPQPQRNSPDSSPNQGGAEAFAFSSANSRETSYKTAPVKKQQDSSNNPYPSNAQQQPPFNYFGYNNQRNPNAYQNPYQGYPQNNANSYSKASAISYAQQSNNDNYQPYPDSVNQGQTPINPEKKPQPDPKQQNPPTKTFDKATNCIRFAETLYVILYKSHSFSFYSNSDQFTSIAPYMMYDGLCSAGYSEDLAQEIAQISMSYLSECPEDSTTSYYAEVICKILMEQLKDYIGNNPDGQAQYLGTCLLASLDKIGQQSSPQDNNNKPNDSSPIQQTSPKNNDGSSYPNPYQDYPQNNPQASYSEANAAAIATANNPQQNYYQPYPGYQKQTPDDTDGDLDDKNTYLSDADGDSSDEDGDSSDEEGDSGDEEGVSGVEVEVFLDENGNSGDEDSDSDDGNDGNNKGNYNVGDVVAPYYIGVPKNKQPPANQQRPNTPYYIADDGKNSKLSDIGQKYFNKPTAEPKKSQYNDQQTTDQPVDVTEDGPITFPTDIQDDSQNQNSTKDTKSLNDTESKDRVKKIIQLVSDCKTDDNKMDYKKLSNGIADIIKSVQDAHPDWGADKCQKVVLIECVYSLTIYKGNDGKCETQQSQQTDEPDQIPPSNQGNYQPAPQIYQNPTYPTQQTNENSQPEKENQPQYQPNVAPANTFSPPQQTFAYAQGNSWNNNGNVFNPAWLRNRNSPTNVPQTDNTASQNYNQNTYNQANPVDNFAATNWNTDNQPRQNNPVFSPPVNNFAGQNNNWNFGNPPPQNNPNPLQNNYNNGNPIWQQKPAPPLNNNPAQYNWNTGNPARQNNQNPAPPLNDNPAQYNWNTGNPARQNNQNSAPPLNDNPAQNNFNNGNPGRQNNQNFNFARNGNRGFGGPGPQQFQQQPQRW